MARTTTSSMRVRPRRRAWWWRAITMVFMATMTLFWMFIGLLFLTHGPRSSREAGRSMKSIDDSVGLSWPAMAGNVREAGLCRGGFGHGEAMGLIRDVTHWGGMRNGVGGCERLVGKDLDQCHARAGEEIGCHPARDGSLVGGRGEGVRQCGAFARASEPCRKVPCCWSHRTSWRPGAGWSGTRRAAVGRSRHRCVSACPSTQVRLPARP